MHAIPSRNLKVSSTHYARTNSFPSLVLAFALSIIATPWASAQTYTVLHNFSGGGDGVTPEAGLTIDAAGNLYGSAATGGGGSGCNGYGCGVVFKLSHKGPGWILTPLHTFEGGSDGNSPQGRVVLARDGTLYGTTTIGGGSGCLSFGCGTVFHLTPPASAPKSVVAPWNETIIHSFDGTDGFEPEGDLTFDQAGNIYGTTEQGGSSACDDNGVYGCGVVYKLIATRDGGWDQTLLFAAQGGSAGSEPMDGVVFDPSGNLYGALEANGPFNWGLIFQLSPSGPGWKEQPAYIFSGGSNGGVPEAGLIADASGNLYGTTRFGGGINPCGTVFELTPSGPGWSINTLYTFLGQPDGCGPQAKLVMDATGSLYGTTMFGGQGFGGGAGTVFKLTPANGGWTYTSLHDFVGTDGAYPTSSLVFDVNGNLYGTTTQGGASNAGVVFEITP
ncbi:MAG: choice-of-anchor tandem repeat GloVer-containing protein [Candidatus Korobacteraceae bacterium]